MRCAVVVAATEAPKPKAEPMEMRAKQQSSAVLQPPAPAIELQLPSRPVVVLLLTVIKTHHLSDGDWISGEKGEISIPGACPYGSAGGGCFSNCCVALFKCAHLRLLLVIHHT